MEKIKRELERELERIRFIESIEKQAVEVEQFALEWMRKQRCLFCGCKLSNLEVERVPYLGYVIHIFPCPRCDSNLLKLYSKDGKFLSVISNSKGRLVYKICWEVGRHDRTGCPIPTSRDYKEKKEGRGRPKKHDLREVDRLIMEFLDASSRLKHGFTTRRIWEHVNFWNKKQIPKPMILSRLKDLELRGHLDSHKWRYGKTWVWYWKRTHYMFSPHHYYDAHVRKSEDDKFPDEELLPYRFRKPYYVDEKGREISIPPYYWDNSTLSRLSPEEILGSMRDYFKRIDLKSKRGQRKLRKIREQIRLKLYGKLTPFVKDLVEEIFG
jgi:hypothetical protein